MARTFKSPSSLCVQVSTESDFMSSADITLPTVFQTAKVLQTIHMGESQARHKSGDVIFSRIKHRIDCEGRTEYETSTTTGSQVESRIRKWDQH